MAEHQLSHAFLVLLVSLPLLTELHEQAQYPVGVVRFVFLDETRVFHFGELEIVTVETL